MSRRRWRAFSALMAVVACFPLAPEVRGGEDSSVGPCVGDETSGSGLALDPTLLPSGAWEGRNDAHGLGLTITSEGLRVTPLAEPDQAWEWALHLERYGAPDDPQEAWPSGTVAYGNRVDLMRGPLIEWFANTPKGIEHGLDISAAGESGLLLFEFSVAGSLVPKVRDDGREVIFLDPRGRPVLICPEILAVDADDRDVDVRWERLEGHLEPVARLRLVLDGSGHRLPIVVRGLITADKGTGGIGPSRSAGTLDAPTGDEMASGMRVLAAPANDLCSGAAVIPGSGPFPYLSATHDIKDATTTGDPPVPSCQTNVSRSIWFRFTPVASGNYTFSLCEDGPTATTVPDTVLALYSSTGACAGLAQLAGGCDDDSCVAGALQSVVSDLLLTAGATYYVVAWQFGTSPPDPGFSNIQLRVTQETSPPLAPPNDQCGGAEVIPGAGPFPYLTAVTADITDATTIADPPTPLCQPNVTRSIWYAFTPAMSGNYTFSACADTPTGTTVDDTVMALYASTGPCGGLTPVAGACNDDSCGVEDLQSILSGVTLSGGATYYLVVWKYDLPPPTAGNTSVQVRVSQVLGPGNDNCTAAIPLALDAPVAGSMAGGSNDYELAPGSACFDGLGQTPSTAPGLDAVYRFSAPKNGAYSFRVSYDATKNAVLYVASDCPAGPAPVTVAGCLGAANRHSGNPAEEVKCLGLASGQTVFVYVDENALTAGGAFTIEVDECLNETEPNDTPGTAGGLVCGMEGSISSGASSDIDFHALGSPASGSRVFALVDGASANSTDFDIRVTTSADTLEYDDLNNDIPFGGSAPNLGGTPLTGVASYLRVTQKGSLTASEPYRIYAAIQAPAGNATAEAEPNNTIAQATTADNRYFSGALSSTSDVDLYSFTAAAGDLILLGLDLDPARNNTPFNGTLALLDSAGATILSVNDGGFTSNTTAGTGNLAATTPSAPSEAIAYRARASATYYARVGFSTGTPGDYLLSIATNCVGSADTDGDAVPDGADCALNDATVWTIPGEATTLAFPGTPDRNQMQWSAPAAPGGTIVRYDVLRTSVKDGFSTATCVGTNLTTTTMSDPATPPTIYYYLVRAENLCGGRLGTRSDGTPITGPACP